MQLTVRPLASILALFSLCSLARYFEYFVLRNDQGPLAENYLHKIFGIAVIAATTVLGGFRLRTIGFHTENFLRNLIYGLALGLFCFSIAYAVEITLLNLCGHKTTLALYTSGFSLGGETVRHTALPYFALCILFNSINVIMEEGLFRGLFITIAKPRFHFAGSTMIAALFFGIWHLTMPLRGFFDGQTPLGTTVAGALVYVVFSTLMAVKWGILFEMSGSLVLPMSEHFINNTIVNILHTSTLQGDDTMQIARILSAQAVSLLIVAIAFHYLYRKNRRNSA